MDSFLKSNFNLTVYILLGNQNKWPSYWHMRSPFGIVTFQINICYALEKKILPSWNLFIYDFNMWCLCHKVFSLFCLWIAEKCFKNVSRYRWTLYIWYLQPANTGLSQRYNGFDLCFMKHNVFTQQKFYLFSCFRC